MLSMQGKPSPLTAGQAQRQSDGPGQGTPSATVEFLFDAQTDTGRRPLYCQAVWVLSFANFQCLFWLSRLWCKAHADYLICMGFAQARGIEWKALVSGDLLFVYLFVAAVQTANTYN